MFPAKIGFELAEALTSLKGDLFLLASSGRGLLASFLFFLTWRHWLSTFCNTVIFPCRVLNAMLFGRCLLSIKWPCYNNTGCSPALSEAINFRAGHNLYNLMTHTSFIFMAFLTYATLCVHTSCAVPWLLHNLWPLTGRVMCLLLFYKSFKLERLRSLMFNLATS